MNMSDERIKYRVRQLRDQDARFRPHYALYFQSRVHTALRPKIPNVAGDVGVRVRGMVSVAVDRARRTARIRIEHECADHAP
jgi:lipase chaperone LimK